MYMYVCVCVQYVSVYVYIYVYMFSILRYDQAKYILGRKMRMGKSIARIEG